MEDKGIVAGMDLAQFASVNFDGLTPPAEPMSFVTGDGSRAVISFTNAATSPVPVAVPGFELLQAEYSYDNGPQVDLATSQTIIVAAGQTAKFAFDITQAGDFLLYAGNQTFPFEVIEAQAVTITLGDFFITPGNLELTAGETYLFQVTNVGATSHNIFLGAKSAEGQTEQWASATIGGGGTTTSFLVTPTESMSLDAWCNVPGHWPQMASTVAVS
jgi:uncharacterized cupredoxin-like copper-binding protein